MNAASFTAGWKSTKTMKKLTIILLFAFVALGTARAQETYFQKEQMPDLVQCLPPPPDTLGTDFDQDILRYMWGKKMRQNAARAQEADRDAIWNLDTLAAIFSEPFGLRIDPVNTPDIYKAFVKGVESIAVIRILPKAHYHRIRPFEYFQEHMLTAWEEDSLRGEGSYPSGHTIRGWAAALVLAQINPAASNALFARGWRYGENRVIVGAHWQSDVNASRPAASIGYAFLQSCPAYKADIEKARKEFLRLTEKRSCLFSK